MALRAMCEYSTLLTLIDRGCEGIMIYICIWEACKRYLSMAFGKTKLIEVDFSVVSIFYSFNDVFVSSWIYGMFV